MDKIGGGGGGDVRVLLSSAGDTPLLARFKKGPVVLTVPNSFPELLDVMPLKEDHFGAKQTGRTCFDQSTHFVPE